MWRILIKGISLFGIIVFLFPLFPEFGHFSIYNTYFIPGRERFAFTSHPSKDTYNIRIDDIPTLFNTHEISGARQKDEFRIIVLGDSSIWGTLLKPDEMITAQLNQYNLSFCGKKARFYNLGHPNPSLIKDLMILDYAQRYQPDYVIWFLTLEAFPLQKQLTKIPLVINNPIQTRELLKRYHIEIPLDDSQLVPPSYWSKSLFGQRAILKDLLELQWYGIMWAATGMDESFPPHDSPPLEYPKDDIQFQDTLPPLNHDELTYNIVETAVRTSPIPILLVNEPMMHSPKSQIRYNLRYPRWAYDTWHEKILELAKLHQWNYLDLWDKITSPKFYTDSAFHLKPAGEALLASYVAPSIQVKCP